MIDATSLELFEDAHEGVQLRLKAMKPCSGDAEEELRMFADLRKTYATFEFIKLREVIPKREAAFQRVTTQMC